MRINFGTNVESKPRKGLSILYFTFSLEHCKVVLPIVLGHLWPSHPHSSAAKRRSATASLQSTAPAVLHKRFSMSSRAPRRRKRELVSGDVGAWESKQFGVELLWFDKFMDLMEKFRMYVSSWNERLRMMRTNHNISIISHIFWWY